MLSDFRFALRTLLKTPIFTLAATACLAIGIGANTVIFTLVNSLLLNPVPVKDASSLVSMQTVTAKSGGTQPLSYPDLEDFSRNTRTLAGIAGFTSPMVIGMSVASSSSPERVFTEFVTADYFDVLGIRPILGRTFEPGEDRAEGAHPVAVMAYALWQQRFAAARDIVGRTVRLNGHAFEIIGVTPEGFKGMEAIFGPDLWLPSAMAPPLFPAVSGAWRTDRAALVFRAAGRLKPGTTPQQAQADLTSIAASFSRDYPDSNRSRGIQLGPAMDAAFSPGQRQGVLFAGILLTAIAGLVLVIACSNVANLLLARATGRRQEIALRTALGAGRARIVRQLLTESTVLALGGGAAGMALAWAGVALLSALRPEGVGRNLAAPTFEPAVFLFALAISLLTGLAFGLAPALENSAANLAGALREGGRTAGRTSRRAFFVNALLAGQVALSLVSLVTAGLFLRSIQRAYSIDPGFETRHLALVLVDPAQAGYRQPQTEQLYRDITARFAGAPGVASVSWASNLPLWARASRSIAIEGDEPRDRANSLPTVVDIVDAGYFRTAGIPLLRGRDFTDADGDRAVPVAIVNQAMAERYFSHRDPLGLRFRFSDDPRYRQIVGIVRNANYTSLGEAPQPCAFIPLRQNFSASMVLYVRTASDPGAVLPAIQSGIRALAPEVPIQDVRTGRTIIDQALWSAKLGAGMLGVFGLLAIVLAAVGLYGVMAYATGQRRREIGIRMALGSDAAGILRLVLRSGLRVVAAGAALGFAASILVARSISGFLFGISPLDPVSLGGSCLLLALAAMLACYLPARRAATTDPGTVLRDA
jgi:putative ABC transport system permease protein